LQRKQAQKQARKQAKRERDEEALRAQAERDREKAAASQAQAERNREEAASRPLRRDMHTPSPPHAMGSVRVNQFSQWHYTLRISRRFSFRPTTDVTESFAAGNTSELDIRVELDVEPYDAVGPITEDICLAIHSSPGVVDTFSTYFKERRNGTCYLNLILYARPSPKKSKRHDYFQVLPLDVRLHSNWVPFGPLLNASVRATCIWFYGDPEGHPDPRD
jgi:hypothetical protein